MVRASLPAAGVAAVLLVASAAVGQTPLPFDEYPSPFILPVAAEVIWEQPAETPPPLELVEDGLVMSAEPAPPPKDSKRIKPTPQKDGATKQPPPTPCPDGGCDVVLEDFPTFCCLPFAAPYPPQQQGCQGNKHHRRNRGGCQNNNYSGYGNGWGNPYLAWPYGPSGCPGFCAPPQQQNCGGRRCHRNKGGCNNGGCNNGGGYGYGGYAGYPGAWGGFGWGGGYPGAWDGFGWDGGFGCGGFCGYYPPPTQQQGCGCHRGQGKHHSRGQNCPRCGYPNGGGYGNAWAFPVPGWSVDCNDGCDGKHGHGLFRRCHANKQQQPQQPYPYCGMMQPCFMDDCFPF